MSVSKNNNFFVSCGLDLENDLKEEISEFWHLLLDKTGQLQLAPLPEFKIHTGGVELSCPYEIGLQINMFSHLANRVLLRLGSFKAKAFSELEKGLQKIPWGEYLNSNKVQVEVSSHQSRLYHKKKIENFIIEYFSKKSFSSQKNNESEQDFSTLYVRFLDDICLISIDTSGEHLHKRGLAELKGEAPLRETLAFYMLRKMIGETPLAELYRIELVDPMCGSGTFLLEALTFYMPQVFRKFNFQTFPSCPKILLTNDFAKKILFSTPVPWAFLSGFDKESKMVDVAIKNLENSIKKIKSIHPSSVLESPQFVIRQQDLFQVEDKIKSTHQKWAIVNPPYGERMKNEHDFNKIILQISKVFDVEKIGLLCPEFKLNAETQQLFKNKKRFPINHGGLKLYFYLFEGKVSES